MVQALAGQQRPHALIEVEEAPRCRDPDHDATQALARGERRAALAILMKAYGEPLYRYCYKVLRSRTLADDVHQLVFLQAFEDMDSCSRAVSFRPWLYAIANHRCLDALKVGRRWSARFTLRGEIPEEADPAPSGEETMAARSLSEALEACLDKLQPHVRIPVLLRYQEGFSYEEISRMCHERPATLQARVARAMPLLRRCLETKGAEL
jgi:RNA polymerase sigma-70 factor (ECF subfamily)